jgi:hypothetical protein
MVTVCACTDLTLFFCVIYQRDIFSSRPPRPMNQVRGYFFVVALSLFFKNKTLKLTIALNDMRIH